MQRLKYMELQKIDTELTKKLLEYISLHDNIEDIFYELDQIFPYLHGEHNNMILNSWLSIDYIGKDGKTFIEKFIQENSTSLTSVEKKILEEKISSYISIFEVLGYRGEYILVMDILNEREYNLWAPQLNNTIDEGEFLFLRIGKFAERYTFIGDINYLPSSVKPSFLEELLVDFNNIRKSSPQLTMKEYLKKHSLNVYRIYNETILDIMDIDSDIHSYLFSELEEFEGYLTNRENIFDIKKHISNLINIFEYTLSSQDLTLYDIDVLDFKSFFKKAIDDNFICSQKELNSYIDTLKKYLKFLSNIDSTYRDTYSKILDISKDRFYYMNKLKNNTIFKIEREFLSTVSYKLNDTALSTVMDYDKFIIYTNDSILKLTAKNKYIKRKDLLEINELLESKINPNTSAPNQKDFPLIHFFYHFSLNLGILEIKHDNLNLTDKGLIYLRLSDEEKYILLFKYLWGEDFIYEVLNNKNIGYYDSIKRAFSKLGSNLRPNNEYNLMNILPDNHKILFPYYRLLKYLGLIDYSFYSNPLISFTFLGKSVFEYLNKRKSKFHTPVIISLDNYRNTQ